MDVTEKLKKLHEYAKFWADSYRKKIMLLSFYAEWLAELDIPVEKLEVLTDGLDFNQLTHEEVIRLISFFGGKWAKELNEASINYEMITDDGIRVRAWAGEPPPSCKIIEIEEYVPASVRTVRKLKCPETLSND